MVCFLGYCFIDFMLVDSSDQVVVNVIYSFCKMENNIFKGGEEIVYKIYYNWNFVWLVVGEVIFKVEDLGNKYYILVYGCIYKLYEWFFIVWDYYDIYVDKEIFLFYIFIRNVCEGGYCFYDVVIFELK